MRRDLNHSIRFGDEEEFTLRHGTSVREGQEICNWYDIIQGDFRRIRFLPAELAELGTYIHEMLRMHGQHVDALTDGAGERVAESDGALSDEGLAMLATLAKNWAINRGHELFPELWDAGLIRRSALEGYCISDAGRALLEAQAPSAKMPQSANSDR